MKITLRNSKLKPNGSSHLKTEELINYYRGIDTFNHWIGPTIARTDSEGKINKHYDEQIKALEREFQAHNVLAEVIDNWRDGLIGEPFAITIRKKGGAAVDDERSQQAHEDLTRWQNFVQSMAVLD